MQKRNGGSRALVIGVHETPASLAADFREQIEWASQHFTITSLEGFAKLWDQHSDSETNLGPSFCSLLTTEERATTPSPRRCLNPLAAGECFLLCRPLRSAPPMRHLLSIDREINPNSRPGDEKWEDWKPMNPAQIGGIGSSRPRDREPYPHASAAGGTFARRIGA